MERPPTLGFDMNDLFFMSTETTYSNDPEELYYQLVSQLLEIERVVINSKMVPFLTNPGVCETILSFVTRVPRKTVEKQSNNEEENDENINNNNNNNDQTHNDTVVDYQRVRETDDISLKKSFNAVYLILNRSNTGMKTYISSQTKSYLQQILKAFLPESNANFNHVKMLIAWSMENFQDFKALLYTSDFIPLALNYLHETSVVDLLLAIISTSVNQSDKTSRKGLIPMIYNKLCSLEDENCGSVLDFILRLIQELAVVPGSDVFLSFLHDKDDDNFVVQLLKSLDNPDCSLIKQKAALSILFTMFSKIHERIAGQQGYNEINNVYAVYREEINGIMAKHLNLLCDILIKSRNPKLYTLDPIQFSSYTARSLTEFRIQLIHIIASTIEVNPDLLNTLPDPIWSVLVSWYFENCNNSVYLIQCSKIFQTVILSKNEDAFKKLTKTKFVVDMIKRFSDVEYLGCRIFSLLLCNQLRLISDANPSTLFRQFLVSLGDIWSSFLPSLREATEVQVMRPMSSFKSHIPHTPPTPLLSPNGVFSLKSGMTVTEGIDLGSLYAFAIGVTTLPSEVPTPSPSLNKKKKKKKKKSSAALNLSSSSSSSSPSSPSSNDNNNDDKPNAEPETAVNADNNNNDDNNNDEKKNEDKPSNEGDNNNNDGEPKTGNDNDDDNNKGDNQQ